MRKEKRVVRLMAARGECTPWGGSCQQDKQIMKKLGKRRMADGQKRRRIPSTEEPKKRLKGKR